MLINHTSKQVTAKIVYYGTGLGGKTTNLQYIFSVTNPNTRGELVSMETEIERTLFFDLLPINVGLLKGYQTKFQLYTVPGQVFYDSTRRLVLKGVDGIVFVADSQELMEPANLESFENLKSNLDFHKQSLDGMPLVFQYNKRDLKNILSVERLNEGLNHLHQPYFEAVASSGRGVIETLRDISSLTLVKIKEALEHTMISTQKLAINFDMDPSHRIYKLKDLPVKKIGMENCPPSSRSR
jgi:signal recognition particle receptor subunit beta